MGERKTKKDSQREKPTEKLKSYCRDLYDPDIRLIVCVGLPSTGKTKCSVEAGIEQILSNKYDSLVLVRPVVLPACGLLPGTLEEKMSPYICQAEAYTNKCSQISFGGLVSDGKIEICAADLLQGRRFQSSFVIADEMQNIHRDDTFKIMSRIGEGSKYIFIGDISQGQENNKIKKNSMLHYLVDNFADEPYCRIHYFYDEDDILGDDITKQIIKKLIPDFVGGVI